MPKGTLTDEIIQEKLYTFITRMEMVTALQFRCIIPTLAIRHKAADAIVLQYIVEALLRKVQQELFLAMTVANIMEKLAAHVRKFLDTIYLVVRLLLQ